VGDLSADFARAAEEARKGGQYRNEGCGWPRLARLPRVPEVRLPSEAWPRFLSGPLSRDDWALIERVEAGEISVDQAMAQRARA
jgi:hypothetical protein